MQVTEVRSDTQFTYATIMMAHGLSRKFRVGRNGLVQIAMSLPKAGMTWRRLRPEVAEAIRRALSVELID